MKALQDHTKFAGYLSCDENPRRYRLRSIDLSHAGLMHKLSFPDLPGIEEILVPPLAGEVAKALDKMDLRGELLSDSDYVVGVPGAVFRKLRVHTRHHPERGFEASFWFGSFEGQPLAAIRHFTEALGRLPRGDHIGKLAVQTLDRVLLPALNVVSALRGECESIRMDGEMLRSYTRRLIEEADDLILYAELVKRMVQEQELALQEAPAEFRHAPMKLIPARS